MQFRKNIARTFVAATAGRGRHGQRRAARKLNAYRPAGRDREPVHGRRGALAAQWILRTTPATAGGVRTTNWGVAPFNLRRGITPNFELGVFVEPYRHAVTQPGTGPSTSESGAGEVTLRAKINFWGNDGGASAFGIILDFKPPLGAGAFLNGKSEGALTLPVSFTLRYGLGPRRNDTGGRGLWRHGALPRRSGTTPSRSGTT